MKRWSGAAAWPVLRQFIDAEARIAARMSRRPATAALYEFLRFGMKQAWACLFGGLMLALLLATYFFYPPDAALARYDFLFLAALSLQVSLLGFGLETIEEAKVIAAYHVVGTVMEIFKTSVGSWIYPEDASSASPACRCSPASCTRASAAIICRAWTLFHFEFKAHPPIAWLVVLSVAIYVNFFAHHYLPDMRWALFIAAAVLFARTRIYFVNWQILPVDAAVAGTRARDGIHMDRRERRDIHPDLALSEPAQCLVARQRRQVRFLVPAADHQLHSRRADQEAGRAYRPRARAGPPAAPRSRRPE